MFGRFWGDFERCLDSFWEGFQMELERKAYQKPTKKKPYTY